MPRAWSQGSTAGGLRGVVTDTTNAVVSNAALTLTENGTGSVRRQLTNSVGQYAFTDVAPGTYSLQVTAQGFSEKRFTTVTVVLNETRELNVTLDPGAVSQVVEVQGEAASVVTLQTNVGTLIDDKKVEELPLNGRDFQNLIFLAPGASRSAGGTGQGSGVSAGGSRPTNNNYLVDGGDANDPRVPSGSAGNTGSAISAVPLDAIAEFSVITSNASAEFGRSSGAVVNVVTKSGSNALHASAWEFLRNSVLNTRNFFDPVGFKSPFKQNQFGFWAGGRIIRDHTFYSVAYEGFRQRSTSPTEVPIPTSQFTSVLTNPLAQALFSTMYPSVSGGAFDPNNTSTWTTTINRNIANNLDGDTGFVRLDQFISSKNQMFATFSIVDSVPAAAINGGNLPHFGVGTVSRPTHIVVQDDHIFSATLMNTARFSRQRTPISYPTEVPTEAEVNAGSLRTAGPDAGAPFSPGVGDPNGIPTIGFNSGRFNSMGVANNMPQSRAPEVFTYQDTVSWQHGRHSIAAGVQISRVWDNTIFSSVIRPSISLLDTSFANINALTLNSQTQDFYIQPSLRQYRLWEQGYFVQDSYRVTNRLTLDLGLRYEIYNPFTEQNDLLSNAYLLDSSNKPEACTPLPFNASL
ncbi:MAG: carboxypeptidase regulatory-like domain-containing protein, partial [Acidobacteriota bacterium]